MIFHNLDVETDLDDDRLRVCTTYGNSPLIECKHGAVCWKETMNTLR
jgi:hypothetical protein